MNFKATDDFVNAYQFIDCRITAAASASTSGSSTVSSTLISTGSQCLPPIITQLVKCLSTHKTLPGTLLPEYRSLPNVLLYDNAGLEYFDRITYQPEYYLTSCELEILSAHTQSIIDNIPNNSDIIELGCGSLRKTEIILNAINKHCKGVSYYAIDVMPKPLHSSMSMLASKFINITFTALCGTYDEVMPHLRKSIRPKTILWLGSSIGNYHSSEAIGFLAGLVRDFLAIDDAIIIGMDMKKDSNVIWDAYNDAKGVTAAFELNILSHINHIIAEHVALLDPNASSDPVFDQDKFIYYGEYDKAIGRFDSFLEARQDTVISWPPAIAAYIGKLYKCKNDMVIKRGERIHIESSYKYSSSAPEVLAQFTGLTFSAIWTDRRGYYTLNLFRKPYAMMLHSLRMTPPASLDKWSTQAAVPKIAEWKALWETWDMLMLQVIGHDKLLVRPIDLRHPFIFYLGHIPAFADIQMTAADSAPLSEPLIFAQWFERGIDPKMDDPTSCHSHSEVPSEWPPVEKIIAYRDRVRVRITKWLECYLQSGCKSSYDAARHVWMAFEHEALHVETLLYMVLQMNPEDICAPATCTISPMVLAWPDEAWLSFAGGNDIVLGNTCDNELQLHSKLLPPGHIFGWDNECPSTNVTIKPFRIRTQPITNIEYFDFLREFSTNDDCVTKSSGGSIAIVLQDLVPKSWIVLTNNTAHASSVSDTGEHVSLAADYGVRTVVGTPSIKSTEASLWPVAVSEIQAEAYAKWHGNRLPTEAEWTHAARTYHLARAMDAILSLTTNFSITAVDTHLDRLLASQGTVAKSYTDCPFDMFVPSDANIGFAHLHPVAVSSTLSSNADADKVGDATFVGNTWEWTATPFYPFNGFIASPMYPGYSADFFDPPEAYDHDSTHYVIKGGSYATHPRIAKRQTFRNWYQRGYPYVLASFRLCEDAS
ncbi:hypothetical protein COEREDRAFT_36756 [Coemansia reversa NRRL 1564]|uniref:Uncharacterized protein n=1 Tax=Coemansia reversa (strain ATCC 12441 / NRRL 1564) TaxID=763665 RepID=A0A2G5BL41_COERN|nr:hypothetical protein COEREDRAFT_36756 [Coemansia reversa NRRL 1564]|eukprot:PIA19487.1 hypothetical protein COEREDRAFT_36756 [Coemansia reversa NRRL 1564]